MFATRRTFGSQQNLKKAQHRSSPSSSRSNIVDRLIPFRSKTNLQLAQHLFSPMSHRAGDHHYDSEQQESPLQVTPILKFGNKVVRATASLVCPKPKFKIPISPHQVMPATEPFADPGYQNIQSTCWAPSANFVVALEDGVYVYKVNEDYKRLVICHNDNDMLHADPLSHVIWNSTGNSIICGSMGGEIQIRDLNTPDSLIKWRMSLYFGVESILHFELGQDNLLTCATYDQGVPIYDLRQTGGSTKPIFSLRTLAPAYSLSWSTNGNLLAVGGEYGEIYLWDVRQPYKEMNILRNQEEKTLFNPVRVVNWCPWKPNVLFSGTSYPKSNICLHDTTTGVLIGDYECASGVSGIQFNAELEQVATSHIDLCREDATRHIHGKGGTVQLWELSSNKLNSIQKLSYHKPGSGIYSLAASANSSEFLTLGCDERLCLWHWNATNKTASHSNANHEAGFQIARSQLDSFNLIR